MSSEGALSRPAAPAPGTVLCSLAELDQTGTRSLAFRDGEKLFMMFLVRTGDGVAGYINSCPHLGTPLNFLEHRFLTPDRARIQCATHGAQFEPATGLCVQGPCLGAHLKPVPVEIDGETVRITQSHS
ncbi:MAG: Rieske 2Fe-2S domain-containing protein [Alphaproteobacteria bacterium]